MSAGLVRIVCPLCGLRRDLTETELGERSLVEVAGPFLRAHARHELKLRWLPGEPRDEPDLERRPP